ncbi:hypothetical protein HLB23_15375 [Nocardia uniformis]|uniref:Uncharacterized protein n=1 Tax=Nocardia uniformis TaxID=53432 RepID=A0A849C456_9NOCA|nr:hypothetical protein [Nocardia uniformis]NNH71230.1 hypothetical protein [Nocardia uniformis]
MAEQWAISEEGVPTESRCRPVLSSDVAYLVRARIGRGRYETWFGSSAGRALAIVTNGVRAMVVLLDGDGDPGEHAVDPMAKGGSTGFILAGGQRDEYPDKDTVPLEEALWIVNGIVELGVPPTNSKWKIDR